MIDKYKKSKFSYKKHYFNIMDKFIAISISVRLHRSKAIS